ncbi:hypothetical protein RB5449 [Rhodopirellula baltica SH 1]|uniref:Uncharacterized protein n=1 Tax=Rhodopirellula baltica (strain DSM 10527 / NCIMB 13988 / SH1) TaxID=243090 RepID=Q7URU3_RHOBA|nr:hypothetical protein RB5449 [Rhodopirellula baltica SH 1]
MHLRFVRVPHASCRVRSAIRGRNAPRRGCKLTRRPFKATLPEAIAIDSQ